MKHSVVRTKKVLRIKLFDNRCQIESFGVLQLGIIGMKNNEVIPEAHENYSYFGIIIPQEFIKLVRKMDISGSLIYHFRD